VTLLERIKPPGEGDRPLPDPRSRS
jgi:hypothetical protein